MNAWMRYTSAMCMLVLCALTCKAEVIPTVHNFNDMRSGGSPTLEWPNGYKEGVTPLVTYTCAGDATFGLSGGVIGISLPNSGNYVTTSPAIDYLKRIQISRTPEYASNVNIYYSTDGSSWTLMTTGVTASRYYIEALMPSRGDYYLKIERASTGSGIFIKQITYYTEPCNCFELEEEE